MIKSSAFIYMCTSSAAAMKMAKAHKVAQEVMVAQSDQGFSLKDLAGVWSSTFDGFLVRNLH